MSTEPNTVIDEKRMTPAGKSLPLWRNRDYLLLIGGQGVSTVGSQISLVAFPLLIFALTHSPAQTGLMASLRSLPYALELTSSVSALLLAFGLIVSMANVLTKGSVLTNNIFMQRICAWTQCIAVDASVAGTVIRTFRYHAENERVKTWLYRLLLALLLFTVAIMGNIQPSGVFVLRYYSFRNFKRFVRRFKYPTNGEGKNAIQQRSKPTETDE